MYWNVNALTRLSFAEHGRVLDAFEVGYQNPPGAAAVTAAVAGLDFERGDRTAAGLLAVQRFTGRGLTPDDLTRIEEADLAHRIHVNQQP